MNTITTLPNALQSVQHSYNLNQQAIFNQIGVEIAEQVHKTSRKIHESSRIGLNRIKHEWNDYCLHVDAQGIFPFKGNH